MTIPHSCKPKRAVLWGCVGPTSKPAFMPKRNSLLLSFLLLISVFADHPVQCAEPTMCSALGAWCISQLTHGTRPKTKRGPEGLSNYRLSFDKVAWLIICFLPSCSWFFVCLYGHFLPFWNTVIALTPFAQCVCVCGEGGRSSFETRERRGGRAAWGSPESEWQRERGKEWERCSALAKENSFAGLDASGV